MINKEKLAHVLVAYRKDFHKKKTELKNKTHWEDEQYKWIAVKHFQDHWDIEAADFAAMFKEAKKAMKLCFEAHKEQLDKSGNPYVMHPLHVAEQMPDETTTVVALLHDVVEDTDYTLEDISAAGFPKVVTDALTLLTHDESVPYLEYVATLRDNPIAKCVKLADLEHNSDLSRIDHPTAEDYLRVQKYEKAMDILEDQLETDVKAYEKGQLTDEWIQIGSSSREYNAVTMIGMRDGQIVPEMLWFDVPGEYYATVIHDGKPVPEGYKEAARFEAFVDTVSVNGDGTYLEGKEIIFYRKGKDGCVIAVKHEEI